MKLGTIILLTTLIFSACARNVSIGGGHTSKYHRAMSSLLREKKLYGIEKVFYKTSILFKTCDLRKAYVEEYADAYKLNESQTKAMLDQELEDCQKNDTFVVSHFSSDRESKKIDKTAGVWKMTLSSTQDRAASVAPVSVVALSGDRPVLTYFYPFISAWSKNYLVKFPKSPAGSTATIYMDGIEKNIEFIWKP